MAQDVATTDMTKASTRRLQRTASGYLLLLLLTLLSQPAEPGTQAMLALTVTGLLCVSAACLGRIWCSVFIAGRKDQELVTHGPYALCRHPLYALSLLGGLGIGLATLSLSLTLAVLAGLWWLLRAAAKNEERHLAARFGDNYERYQRETPSLWPGRWQRVNELPTSLNVHPPILWKAFVDAGAFFVLFVCVVLARQISLQGLLASWLVLP